MIDSTGKCSVCGMVMPPEGLTLHSCGGVPTFPLQLRPLLERVGPSAEEVLQIVRERDVAKARAERAERQAEALAKALAEALDVLELLDAPATAAEIRGVLSSYKQGR